MLAIGDTIRCKDSDDAVNVMKDLAKEGIDTDFLYEKNGEKGIWLEIIKINEV